MFTWDIYVGTLLKGSVRAASRYEAQKLGSETYSIPFEDTVIDLRQVGKWCKSEARFEIRKRMLHSPG